MFFPFYRSPRVSCHLERKRMVRRIPRGEAPGCLFLSVLSPLFLSLQSSMRINGEYEALIADVVKGSQSVAWKKLS